MSPPILRHAFGDQLGRLALVKALAVGLFQDASHSRCKVGQAQRFALTIGGVAALQIGVLQGLGARVRERRQDIHIVRQRLGDGESLFAQTQCRRQQRVHRQRGIVLVQHEPRVDQTRHRDGARPNAGDAGCILIHRRPSRRQTAGVEALDLIRAAAPDQREGIAAELRRVGLRHGQHRGGSQQAVHRVAAALHRVHGRQRRLRVVAGHGELVAVNRTARRDGQGRTAFRHHHGMPSF